MKVGIHFVQYYTRTIATIIMKALKCITLGVIILLCIVILCYSYTIGASGLPDIHEWFSLR